jgi:tetratricopeptide (TPR) repeat protein
VVGVVNPRAIFTSLVLTRRFAALLLSSPTLIARSSNADMATPPLPKQVGAGKFYLAAFDLVVTVPTQEQAEAVECGLLSLVQYRGNPLAEFNVAMGRPADDTFATFDPQAPPCDCMVAMATRLQLYASVMAGERHADSARLLELAASRPELELWETKFINATAAFIRLDYESATEQCLKALEATPHDAFSARLLLITSYFGEDLEGLCDGFSAIATDYMRAIDEQEELRTQGVALEREHALHLALPSLLAWAAFGYEESRRCLRTAEDYARRAVALTQENNRKYFPSGRPADDVPVRRGALAATSDDVGFTCVFGVHVVCHCFETRNDPRGGLAYLTDEVDERMWQPAVHLAGHLWWHVALFQLEAGEIELAMLTFSDQLGAPPTADPFALSDSASLVLRVWLWSQYFRLAPQDGTDKWNRVTLTPELETRVAQAISTLNEQWQTYSNDVTASYPFFDVHKQFVHAAAAWIVKSGDCFAFRPWPVKVPFLTTGLDSASSADIMSIPTGRARRDALVLGMREGSQLVQAAAVAPLPHIARLHFSAGISRWLRLVDDLSAKKPSSLVTRIHRTALPMGGSIAQQRLVSTSLMLMWLLSDRRNEAAVAVKGTRLLTGRSTFMTAVVLSSGL